MSNMEHVNHPAHYQRKDGIETIEVIRHYVCDIANALKYLMRAGKKQEMGMEDAEKEIEDLKKALWYIKDYLNTCVRFGQLLSKEEADDALFEITGYRRAEIIYPYPAVIQHALSLLSGVGFIFQGEVRHVNGWRDNLITAYGKINERIKNLEYQKERIR